LQFLSTSVPNCWPSSNVKRSGVFQVLASDAGWGNVSGAIYVPAGSSIFQIYPNTTCRRAPLTIGFFVTSKFFFAVLIPLTVLSANAPPFCASSRARCFRQAFFPVKVLLC